MTGKRLCGVLGLVLAGGCGDGPPTDPDDGSAIFFLSTLARETNPQQTRTFTCSLIAQARFDTPLQSGAVSPAVVDYQREVVGGAGPQLKTVRMTQDLGIELLGGGNIRVTLGAPEPATMEGQQAADGTFRGDWTCGPDFPFARDPDLIALGQDSSASIAGSWIFQRPADP